MPLLFDATLKDLGRRRPEDFLSTFDAPPTELVSLLNIDLSTVTTAGDLILGIGRPAREILHFDFQASASADKHADLLVYNALLHRQYRVPVHTTVLLLRPQAAHSNLNGTVAYAPRQRRGRMEFGYEVVRLWTRPVEEFLAGAVGTLPFAVLGRLPAGVSLEDGLARVVQQMCDRILAEVPTNQARDLLAAAYNLTGLRIARHVARRLFRGVTAMHESDTYQGILDEGAIREAKRLILRQGRKRFGAPDEATVARLEASEDLDDLERLSERLLDVATWQELFAAP